MFIILQVQNIHGKIRKPSAIISVAHFPPVIIFLSSHNEGHHHYTTTDWLFEKCSNIQTIQSTESNQKYLPVPLNPTLFTTWLSCIDSTDDVLHEEFKIKSNFEILLISYHLNSSWSYLVNDNQAYFLYKTGNYDLVSPLNQPEHVRFFVI